MAATIAQQTSEYAASSASPAVTFGSAPTAGNLIVVTISSSGGATHNSFSDGTNTYTKIQDKLQTNIRTSIWYAYNISGGSALTVTGSLSSSAACRMIAVEFAGIVSASDPLDVSTLNGGTGTTASTGSITTTKAAGCLIVAAVGSLANAGTIVDPPTSFTSIYLDNNAAAPGAAADWRSDTSTATWNPSWTVTSSRWAAVIASFELAASGFTASAASSMPKLTSAAVAKQYLVSPSPALIPTTWTDNSGIGTLAWTNPGNASASDATYATNSMGLSSDVTHYLRGVVMPQMAIRPGSGIVGLKAEVRIDAVSHGYDLNVRLVRSGSVDTSTTKTITKGLDGLPSTQTFGGASDTWGVTLTATELSAGDFGVAIWISNIVTPFSESPGIDYAQLTAYWLDPVTGTATSTLPKLTSSATGVMQPKAAAASTLPKLASAATAYQIVKATAASTLPKLTTAATAAQVHKATAASSLPKLASSAAGAQILKATAASSVPKLTSAAVAKQILSAAAASTLPKLTSAAVAYLQPRAVGASTIPMLRALGAVFIPTAARSSSRIPMLTSAGIGYRYPGYSGALPSGSVAVAVVGPSGAVTVAQVGPSGTVSIGTIVGPGGTASITQGPGGSVSLSLTGPGGSVQGN